jgi:hypothetical protein
MTSGNQVLIQQKWIETEKTTTTWNFSVLLFFQLVRSIPLKLDKEKTASNRIRNLFLPSINLTISNKRRKWSVKKKFAVLD